MTKPSNTSITAKVCQRWLELVAAAHIIGGIFLFLGFPTSVVDGYVGYLLNQFEIASDAGQSLTYFLIRLFGATISSWGLLMWYMIRRVTLKQDEIAGNILIIATLLWFIMDTGLSLRHGVMIHAALNVLAIVSIIGPLLGLKYLNRHGRV